MLEMHKKNYTISTQAKVFFSVDQVEYNFSIMNVSPSAIGLNVMPGEIDLFSQNRSFDQATIELDEQVLGTLDLNVAELTSLDNSRYIRVWLHCCTKQSNHFIFWKLIYYSQPDFSPPCKQPVIHPREAPRIPGRGVYTEKARQSRLHFLRQQTSSDFQQVSQTRFDPQQLTSTIEGFIGSVEVPIGAAGPLLFQGRQVQGHIYAPFATSEGALVASATRGALAVTCCGGVRTRVLERKMMRVPLFVLSDISMASFFSEWLQSHVHEIRCEVQKYSHYANLVAIEPQLLGKQVHAHFIYTTGDAAGQNMTTSCTWHACQWILQKMQAYDFIKFDNFIIESNLSSDKKVTYQTFIKGRGIRVIAEATLTQDTIKRVLKTDVKQLYTSYLGFVNASTQSGMIGFNINTANVIAAMFTALGQDIACVHECSLAQLHIEPFEDGLYVSMILPSLIIGTVGGGTWLPQQKECLTMLDCVGPGKVERLAEIIAGFCLALDISTLAAISAGHFAKAHEKLGRNRPVNYLKMVDLNKRFFETAIRRHMDDPDLRITAAEPVTAIDMETSIITQMTGEKTHKLIGHLPFALTLKMAAQVRQTDVLVKSKPTSGEVVNLFSQMAAMCDPSLAKAYEKYKAYVGFAGCDERELAVLSQKDSRFVAHVPEIYGVFKDVDREIFIIIEEHLKDMELMDSADDLLGWSDYHISTAIDGIAQCHAIWYGKENELKEKSWIGHIHSTESMKDMASLWESLAIHMREEFPDWVSVDDFNQHIALIRNMDVWWKPTETMQKTLIHNDFNPRNLAFRRHDDQLRVCVYDWELATIGLPQHDLAELLVFTLFKEQVVPEKITYFIEYHRLALEQATQLSIDPDEWKLGFCYAFYDLVINRLALYMMAHTFRHFAFMPRVLQTAQRMLYVLQDMIHSR
ncbi:MAG: phosphotransferase [Pseudomonadota bacterium]